MRQAQVEEEKERAEQKERMMKVDRDRLELLENLRLKQEEDLGKGRHKIKGKITLGQQNDEV